MPRPRTAAGSEPGVRVGDLVRATHPGPAVAVTCLAVLLSVAAGNDAGRTGLLGLAVLSGQLTIGWTNDLLDAERDRAVGRTDKPIATGALPARAVRAAVAVALVGSVVTSLGCGLAAATTHLLLVVGSGWAYNAGLKQSLWSWAPYAVAFGSLPAVVTLAGRPAQLPPLWMLVCGSLLGVGAHVVNVLPDLADDAATGVSGMPHRLGERRARWLAAAVLGTASVVAVLGPGGTVPGWAWAALVLAAGLVTVAVRGSGRAPFRAAVGVALLAVAVLVLRG